MQCFKDSFCLAVDAFDCASDLAYVGTRCKLYRQDGVWYVEYAC